MLQHYVLTLDPQATYDWGRLTLRHPLRSEHPALAALVSEQVDATTGQFLVSVEIKVTVLQAAPLDRPTPTPPVSGNAEPMVTHDCDATEPLPAVHTP